MPAAAEALLLPTQQVEQQVAQALGCNVFEPLADVKLAQTWIKQEDLPAVGTPAARHTRRTASYRACRLLGLPEEETPKR